MNQTALADNSIPNADALDFDAIVIGSGISGMYQLYRLRELGLKVRVLETGTGVGGTWYWNRYPGARFDSESYSYGYSFSKELLDEWDWSESFSGQPEIERYCNLVADKFDLRKDIQFSARVAAAHYEEDACCWAVTLADGTTYRARFIVSAIGLLSTPTMPKFEGIEDFKGPVDAYRPLAKRRHRLCRQTGRGCWHWCQRRPGDPGDFQDGQAPHGIPTAAKLVHAAA